MCTQQKSCEVALHVSADTQLDNVSGVWPGVSHLGYPRVLFDQLPHDRAHVGPTMLGRRKCRDRRSSAVIAAAGRPGLKLLGGAQRCDDLGGQGDVRRQRLALFGFAVLARLAQRLGAGVGLGASTAPAATGPTAASGTASTARGLETHHWRTSRSPGSSAGIPNFGTFNPQSSHFLDVRSTAPGWALAQLEHHFRRGFWPEGKAFCHLLPPVGIRWVGIPKLARVSSQSSQYKCTWAGPPQSSHSQHHRQHHGHVVDQRTRSVAPGWSLPQVAHQSTCWSPPCFVAIPNVAVFLQVRHFRA